MPKQVKNGHFMYVNMLKIMLNLSVLLWLNSIFEFSISLCHVTPLMIGDICDDQELTLQKGGTVSLLIAFNPLYGCRFLMGREKDGVESEVARLINESLEEEKSSKKVCFFPRKKLGHLCYRFLGV